MKKKRINSALCLTNFDNKFNIFVCNDSSDEMWTISVKGKDYSVLIRVVNFD